MKSEQEVWDLEWEAEYRQKLERKRIRQKRFLRAITGKKQVIGLSSRQCLQMKYNEVISWLRNQEFYNINVTGCADLTADSISQEGMVKQITINGRDIFCSTEWFSYNARINIVYHIPKMIAPPMTSRYAKGLNIEDVIWTFRNAGFINVYRKAIRNLITGWIVKADSVEKVTIDGKENFKKNDCFRPNAKIVISYHTFKI